MCMLYPEAGDIKIASFSNKRYKKLGAEHPFCMTSCVIHGGVTRLETIRFDLTEEGTISASFDWEVQASGHSLSPAPFNLRLRTEDMCLFFMLAKPHKHMLQKWPEFTTSHKGRRFWTWMHHQYNVTVFRTIVIAVITPKSGAISNLHPHIVALCPHASMAVSLYNGLKLVSISKKKKSFVLSIHAGVLMCTWNACEPYFLY